MKRAIRCPACLSDVDGDETELAIHVLEACFRATPSDREASAALLQIMEDRAVFSSREIGQ